MKTVEEDTHIRLDTDKKISTNMGFAVSEFDGSILVGLEENSDEAFEKFINDTGVMSDFGFPSVMKLTVLRSRLRLKENDTEEEINRLFDRIFHCVKCAFSIINTEMEVLSGKGGFWSVNYIKNFFDFVNNDNNGDSLLKDEILNQEELEQLKKFRDNMACFCAEMSSKKLIPLLACSCAISQWPNMSENFEAHELMEKVFERYIAKFLNIKPCNLENGYF